MELLRKLSRIVEMPEAEKVIPPSISEGEKAEWLFDHLKMHAPFVEKEAEKIGWDFRLNKPDVVADYYRHGYPKLIQLVESISLQHGFEKGDIEAKINWIPDLKRCKDVVTVDDTIGEWHVVVGYKGIYLFGLCLNPFEEFGDYYASASEDVGDMFDPESFGYELNPYVDFPSKEDLVRFLHDFFEKADIKGYYENEMERKRNHLLRCWVGPKFPKAKEVAEKYVYPLLEESGFKIKKDEKYDEYYFHVYEIDYPKAKAIVDECRQKYGHVYLY